MGFLSGAFSKFLTTPIANIVTRKQITLMVRSRDPERPTNQDSVRSIVQEIYREQGLRGLWSGYSASLVLTLNPSLTFFFYEALKRSFLTREKRSNPSPQATFLLAAMSKMMASTITYPFSLAKSRLQSSTRRGQFNDQKSVKLDAQSSQQAPKNVFSVILEIVRTEGFGALYEGLDGEILKGFFSHGITMIVKEQAHKLVIRLYYILLKLLRKYPSPQELAEAAKGQAGELVAVAAGGAKEVASSMKIQAAQIVDDLGGQAEPATNTARGSIETLTEKGQELVDLTYDYFNGKDET